MATVNIIGTLMGVPDMKSTYNSETKDKNGQRLLSNERQLT
jgi:hypothetical protein